MDFDDTPGEAGFRAEVRSFLEANEASLVSAPRDASYVPTDIASARRTQQLLAAQGYVCPTWPRDYGGGGRSVAEEAILDEELDRARISGPVNYIGLHICGPALLRHGTDAQREALPRLVRGEESWCQLFSEPGGGSDLAALTTKATRMDDGRWKLDGQKVWTSGAAEAEYGIALARTAPGRHRGITAFVVDMRAPSVTVRPIRQMSGRAEFNEVFFDGAVVAADAVVGEVNGGWTVALTMLTSERLSIGTVSEMGATTEQVLAVAREVLPTLSVHERAIATREIGRLVARRSATRLTGLRRRNRIVRGEDIGSEGSAGKLAATRDANLAMTLIARLCGSAAVDATDPLADLLLTLPSMSIAGGTDEILRDIIGERTLGLKREPRAVA